MGWERECVGGRKLENLWHISFAVGIFLLVLVYFVVLLCAMGSRHLPGGVPDGELDALLVPDVENLDLEVHPDSGPNVLLERPVGRRLCPHSLDPPTVPGATGASEGLQIPIRTKPGHISDRLHSSGGEGRGRGLGSEAQEEAALADAGVADEEQLESVVVGVVPHRDGRVLGRGKDGDGGPSSRGSWGPHEDRMRRHRRFWLLEIGSGRGGEKNGRAALTPPSVSL